MTSASTAEPFKRRHTEPIPPGAKVTLRGGKRIARWKDVRGISRSATVILPDRGPHAGQQRILVESVNYYGDFWTGDGKRKRIVLGRDLESARKKLSQKIATADRIRAELASTGELRQEEKIDRHLNDFEQALSTVGNRRARRGKRKRRPCTPDYVKQTLSRAKTVIRGCGFSALEDIRLDPVTRFIETMNQTGIPRKLHTNGETACTPIGARTCNGYVDATRGFVAWCIQSKLLPEDRLSDFRYYDESDDVKRRRRALTEDEAMRLIDAATRRPMERAKFFLKFDGRDATDADRAYIGLRNALAYKTAIYTGLRLGELAQLTWDDCDLDAGRVIVPASVSKNGCEQAVALRDDHVTDLERWRKYRGNPGDAQLVFKIPERFVRVLKHDLTYAGIEFKDSHGRQVDVHALRTTCGSWMAAVAPRTVVGRHLRHGKTGVTDRYIELELSETRAAIAQFPPLPVEFPMYTHKYTANGGTVCELASIGASGLQTTTKKTRGGSRLKPKKIGFSA